MTNWETSKSFFDKINVAHFDVPNEVMDYLKDPKSISQKIPYNKNLIGHIKEEYHYDAIPNMVADFLIEKTKHKPVSDFVNYIEVLEFDAPIKLGSLWTNHQRKYEFNPIHTHNGFASFIIFLEIPYDLNDELNYFTELAGHNQSHYYTCTSKLALLTMDRHFKINANPIPVDKSFEGKMLMFPAHTPHIVYPFYTSDGVRRTVSGNLIFKNEKF